MEIKKLRTLILKFLCSFDFLVFFIFAFGFILWRYGLPIVWDDTNVYKISLFDPKKSQSLLDQILKFPFYFLDSLSNGFQGSGYRPLAFIWIYYSYFIASILPSLSHLIIVSFFIGLSALFFKIIASRFINSNIFVVFCLVIFMFSSPVVQSSWIFYAGVPAFIPLFSCIGLYIYFKSDEILDNKFKYYLYLFALTLLTTWYREFMVALPLTILGMELINKCISYNKGIKIKLTKMVFFCIFLIILSFFPTLLPFLFFQIMGQIYDVTPVHLQLDPNQLDSWERGLSLPLKPSFLLGSVAAQLSSNSGLVIKEEVSNHLLNIPSPTMLIICYLSFVFHKCLNFKESLNLKDYNLDSILAFFGIIFGFIGLLSIILQIFDITYYSIFLPYHLCILSVIFVSASIDKRLTVWFLVFLGPFYFVFTERVHLTYVMMPFAIIITAVFLNCWNKIKTYYSSNFNFIYFFVLIGICFGILDSLTNSIAVRSVMSKTSKGIYELSRKIKDLKGSKRVAIISNTISMHDMRIYFDSLDDNPKKNPLHYKYEVLLTVKAGHDGSIRTVTTPMELQEFLDKNYETHDIYFLNTYFDRLPRKKGYHQHNLIDKPFAKTKNLGEIYHTKVEYFMPDLLRNLTDRKYYAFLGPPDLQDDFYYGPSEKMFFGKVEAKYSLYKVISNKVDDLIYWDQTFGSPKLVKSFLNYNIVTYNGYVYGVPHGLWVDWFNDDLKKIKGMIVGKKVLDGLKEILDLEKQIKKGI